jgi:hypothetical protein
MLPEAGVPPLSTIKSWFITFRATLAPYFLVPSSTPHEFMVRCFGLDASEPSSVIRCLNPAARHAPLSSVAVRTVSDFGFGASVKALSALQVLPETYLAPASGCATTFERFKFPLCVSSGIFILVVSAFHVNPFQTATRPTRPCKTETLGRKPI